MHIKRLSKTAFLGCFLGGVIALPGCSTISSGMDSVGEGVISLGDKLQSVSGNVTSKKIAKDTFLMTEFYYEPVNTFDSWSLRSAAKKLCPDGYVHLSRQALKAGAFAYSHVQCEGEQSCGYKLQWRIHCEEVPNEPFSLFGKI